MSGRRLYILDVFAESKYAGNQLAVVRDAAELETHELQAIAREMNYSETTFLMDESPREGGYDVRIFTPAQELPFAGHPTLGTAWLIREELCGPETAQLTLNLGIGPVAVRFEPSRIQ